MVITQMHITAFVSLWQQLDATELSPCTCPPSQSSLLVEQIQLSVKYSLIFVLKYLVVGCCFGQNIHILGHC